MLTKAQKMQMVSDAIDKGFKVELKKHDTNYDEATELLGIFSELPVNIGGHSSNGLAWLWVNVDVYNDKFEATIYMS